MSEAQSNSSTSSGCGCVGDGSTSTTAITVSVSPTTGGQFDVTVERGDSVDNLKKIISKRLKVAKERICLLHRERQLREGTLEENRLQDGSRLTLLPSVETGLLAQRPEQSVMQALESLSDSQVNDFLSGKAPLNLTMRLGDHMMLIQLQLSTVTPATTQPTQQQIPIQQHQQAEVITQQPSSPVEPAPPPARRSSGVFSSLGTPKIASASATPPCPSQLSVSSSLVGNLGSTNPFVATSTPSSLPCCSSTQQLQHLQQQQQNPPSTPPTTTPSTATASTTSTSTTRRHHRHLHNARHSSSSHHFHHHHHHIHHHHHHHHHRSARKNGPAKPYSASSSCPSCDCSLEIAADCDSSTPPKKQPCNNCLSIGSSSSNAINNTNQELTSMSEATPLVTPTNPDAPGTSTDVAVSGATLDPRALLEASRNLTQKLKMLSSEQENAKRRQGAIIESMHHHGKGVYTGTFSGTLNPALQDRHGRPKRDISTIIHILNDLLCATPATTAGHYRYHRHSTAQQQHQQQQQQQQHQQQQQRSLLQTSSSQTSNANFVPNSVEAGLCPDSPKSGYSNEELSKENEATKGKMRRLRLVMEQRREKMRARRQARVAPYTTKWAASTPTPTETSSLLPPPPASPLPSPASPLPSPASPLPSPSPLPPASPPPSSSSLPLPSQLSSPLSPSSSSSSASSSTGSSTPSTPSSTSSSTSSNKSSSNDSQTESELQPCGSEPVVA